MIIMIMIIIIIIIIIMLIISRVYQEKIRKQSESLYDNYFQCIFRTLFTHGGCF